MNFWHPDPILILWTFSRVEKETIWRFTLDLEQKFIKMVCVHPDSRGRVFPVAPLQSWACGLEDLCHLFMLHSPIHQSCDERLGKVGKVEDSLGKQPLVLGYRACFGQVSWRISTVRKAHRLNIDPRIFTLCNVNGSQDGFIVPEV